MPDRRLVTKQNGDFIMFLRRAKCSVRVFGLSMFCPPQVLRMSVEISNDKKINGCLIMRLVNSLTSPFVRRLKMSDDDILFDDFFLNH